MTRTGVQDELVKEEYAQWNNRQEEIIQELGRGLRAAESQGRSSEDDRMQLARAVDRAIQQCQNPRTRLEPEHSSLVSRWGLSAAERAFMWMGSVQRPSTAFQLLYALMGHHIQAELEELLDLGNAEDGRPSSLASLSAQQLNDLHNLQTRTVHEEDRIELEMTKVQQSVAGPTLPRSDAGHSRASEEGSSMTQENSALSQRVVALQELCVQADALRQSTLERVLELLHTPYHKAQFLLAFAKLQFALGKLGQYSEAY
ncbi:hypothetical protein L7F22_001606 [Adiantum nelumboides]|nr:hypothetical protein [Adiantum nelumboides]